MRILLATAIARPSRQSPPTGEQRLYLGPLANVRFAVSPGSLRSSWDSPRQCTATMTTISP